MIRLFRYLKPYILLILILLGLMYYQAWTNLQLPNLMSKIVTNGIFLHDTNYIWKIGEEMLVITFLGAIAAVITSLISSHVANRFGKKIRGEVFRKVEGYSLNEFDKIGTATLITRSTNDITQVQFVTLMMMRLMLMAPMMAIGGIYMALKQDVSLSWTLVVSIPIIILVVVVIAGKGIPLFKSLQKKLDKLNLVLRENLTGIRVIRAFNKVDEEKKRFEDANFDLTETAIKVNKLMAYMMPIMMLIMNYTTIAILWIASTRAADNIASVGNMMAFIQYAMQIMFSLLMVSMIFILIPRGQASAVRINEVLDLQADITNPKQSNEDTNQRGHVEFQNVDFSYRGAEQKALNNVSFVSKPGQVTAIIGGTGSGKSTLISLLPRFYDVTSGAILIDGIDIREMSQQSLRQKIGFVPQKALLFTGTIAENVRYGKPDATDEEIIEALKTSQAYDFVTEMPDGLNSIISQGGTNYSGGQKQRLSIARALVRKPEIYVFDDSFSALDFKTDAKLRKALKEYTHESAVLIVAQRVSTVMDADQIIVLDDGAIVGIGNHQELMVSCPVYNEIVSSQLSEEELA